jgi:hypothetical protein
MQLVERCWAADFESRPDLDDVIEELEVIAKTIPPSISSETPKGGNFDGSSNGCCTVQ